MSKPWENNSGVPDPTAYAAVKPLTAEEKLVDELVKTVKAISRWAGFDITNRIEFKSRKTGRMYR